MRRLIAFVVGLVVVCAAGTALAQTDDTQEDPEQQFIEFDADELSGERQTPNLVRLHGLEESNFDSLLELERKSFMTDIDQSGEAGALD